MNRREAIEKTALALGYAISAPVLSGVLNGCKPSPELSYQPVFFNEKQAETLSLLAEIIIPKTDTPGAIEAGVPSFMDTLLNEFYGKEDQDKFLEGLSEFENKAKETLGNNFSSASAEERQKFFETIHRESLEKSQGGDSSGWWNAGSSSEKPFIIKVKEMTLLGFFTSEIGATQVLQYNPAPGPYQGCVPLTQVGKAWATG